MDDLFAGGSDIFFDHCQWAGAQLGRGFRGMDPCFFRQENESALFAAPFISERALSLDGSGVVSKMFMQAKPTALVFLRCRENSLQ